MPALATPLRKDLDKAVIRARKVAEQGAAASLIALGYAEPDRPGHLSADDAALRTALRARGRQLGEAKGETGVQQGQQPLTGEIAYEQWHRMLFARFLAENGLLRHPEGASLTIEMCAELALDEGARDGWDLAARYAGAMLPGLFRASDPAVRVRLAREHYLALEDLVEGLPEDVFSSDDGLGWVYQFWQTERKKQINKSEVKIGAAELPAVTQLFTEPYMVDFLLQNTLGAWWAGKYPDSPLLAEMPYLRYGDDGRPAAGTFDGWAKTVAELKVLDPCCGSGHFLVAAFGWLRRMREVEDGLAEADAADAVLRDNLFGLELDRRCTQIAMFNVALAAWRVGGHPESNVPQVACSGTPVKGQLTEWTSVAYGDEGLELFLSRLYEAFQQAPVLGSLIDPNQLAVDTGTVHKRQEMIATLRRKDEWRAQATVFRRSPRQSHDALVEVVRRFASDSDLAIFADGAEEVARAATILSARYDLIFTNPPFKGIADLVETVGDFVSKHHESARRELATAFIDRCLGFGGLHGTAAMVTPQNWLFQDAFGSFRRDLLLTRSFNCVVDLGPSAFQDMNWWAARTALIVISAQAPSSEQRIVMVDGSDGKGIAAKQSNVLNAMHRMATQARQTDNPDSRILVNIPDAGNMLGEYARTAQGIKTGDDGRYKFAHWEFPSKSDNWIPVQGTVESTRNYGGIKFVIRWEQGKGSIHQDPGARIQGIGLTGHRGVAVSQMSALPVTLYSGIIFDSNVSPIVPAKNEDLSSVWAYCSSPAFLNAVKTLEPTAKANNGTLVKVPFDLGYWTKVAAEQYPNGLPEPHSEDLTQWLFTGHPKGSDDPLHVALARLLGYRWPDQPEDDHGLRGHADPDGIVCLPAVSGEQPAHLRLRELLRAAWGDDWGGETVAELVAGAGSPGKTLEDWLRDDAFRQHCALFHNRPFLWNVWDGRKDGFSAIVNYHRLDAAVLDKLTYTYLGDWIGRQKQAAEASVPGADARWQAALALQRKLELIRQGEAPYDIYVRWKPLDRQSSGWEPDLDDGVRLNVRPFFEAGVLRAKFTVKWGKDRGANPEGADVYRWSEAAQRAVGIPVAEVNGKDRLNDLHLSLATKQAAREEAKANPEVAAAPTGRKGLLG